MTRYNNINRIHNSMNNSTNNTSSNTNNGAGSSVMAIQFLCEPRFTGSYGTLYSFHQDCPGSTGIYNKNNQSPPAPVVNLKQSWHDLKTFKDVYDVHSDAKTRCLSDRFKDRILEFVATPGMAVKIIKIHLEMPNKKGILAFQEETSKIRLIRKALGGDFEEYTCVRSVSRKGPFSFMLNIRPEHRGRFTFELNIGSDKTFRTHQLFMILQEKGKCDLRTLMRQSPDDVDVAELDHNIAQFMGRLHASNIVHKDIKPANIVYFPHSSVRYKVIDYGLCSSLSDPTQSWKAKGTPGYMSPVFLMSNGYTLTKVYAQYVSKRIHQNLYGLAMEKYRSVFGELPIHKSLIMARLQNPGVSPPLTSRPEPASGDWYELHYELILKKNDEFAYAIILLELQFMRSNGGGRAIPAAGGTSSSSSLSLKRRLNQLLGYEKLYFQGRLR